MRSVVYKNIPNETIRTLAGDDYNLVGLSKEQDLIDAHVFLLGEEEDIISEVQHISRLYPELGILILPKNPALSNHLKAAVQFAPFISKFIRIIGTTSDEELREIIKQEADLAIARKNFQKIRIQSIGKNLRADKSNHSLKSKFLDKFLAHAPVGAILLNENDIILDVNDYVKELLENREIITNSIYDVFPDHGNQLRGLLNQEDYFDEDLVLNIYKKGELVHLQLFVSQIPGLNANYKMVIVLDVTREVKAEERAHEYLAQLENHNKELEQFAYIVSHDLKNPITSISVSCEMAEEAAPDEKDQYLKIINRSVNNLLQMIQGLEQIIDVRKEKDQKAPLILFKEILDDILNEYTYEITNDKVKITTDFQVESILYIRSYIHSIFQNMISNAIKYRKKDEELNIHISTGKANGYTLITFQDNGIGIDLEKNRENLFQPFRRFTTQATGKGIGLNIVKSMIEKNNGKIEVESSPGAGTKFYCYLCPYN